MSSIKEERRKRESQIEAGIKLTRAKERDVQLSLKKWNDKVSQAISEISKIKKEYRDFETKRDTVKNEIIISNKKLVDNKRKLDLERQERTRSKLSLIDFKKETELQNKKSIEMLENRTLALDKREEDIKKEWGYIKNKKLELIESELLLDKVNRNNEITITKLTKLKQETHAVLKDKNKMVFDAEESLKKLKKYKRENVLRLDIYKKKERLYKDIDVDLDNKKQLLKDRTLELDLREAELNRREIRVDMLIETNHFKDI